jgi:hypothetical protein
MLRDLSTNRTQYGDCTKSPIECLGEKGADNKMGRGHNRGVH